MQDTWGDAIFKIPAAAMLSKIVDGIDKLELGDEDSKGDLYEYLLSKVATAGTNGQFRTPRHIIKMMVALVKPSPEDIIIDPAMGSAGFLIEAQSYLRENHADLLKVTKTKKTELLFLALFLRILKKGGRGAVIVPDGVLFGSSIAHKQIRKEIIDNNKLDAESDRAKTEQSFFVLVEEIVANDYDLSINKYKEIVYEAVQYEPTDVIMGKIEAIETEIQTELAELKKLLG